MEKTKANDHGRGWRDGLRKELITRVDPNGNPIYVFDPTLEEQNKVGMDIKSFHKKMAGWILGGNADLIAEGTNLIWKGKDILEPIPGEEGKFRHIKILGDIDYVLNSNFLICRMEPGDQPCGTYGEALLAYMYNIPIYVIQTQPRDAYAVSFNGWVAGSGGQYFDNPTQLLEFIDSKYKLKVKK